MKFLTLTNKLRNGCWYIDPLYFKSLRESVESFKEIHSGDLEDTLSVLLNQRPPMAIDSNGIAAISVSGTLARECSPLEKLFGLTSYGDITQDVNDAVEAGAKAIIFECDSPGGETNGCSEAASVIANAGVPTASFTSGLDCSACYYLSSSVDRKFASPSSFTGSIGTILPIVDETILWETMGVKFDPIVGEGESLKAAGMGPGGLSDVQREHLQDIVNQSSAAFRQHVGNYRDIPFTKLKGGAFLGHQAKDLGLIDRVGSYDDAYNYLLRKV
jgi:ClpP class serine protease